MSTRHVAPTSQWREQSPSGGSQLLVEVYLKETAPDVFEPSDVGPPDAVLVVDDTTDPPTMQINDDINAIGRLRLWMDAADNLYPMD